ncbi:tRNA pseudouridine(38-40) synthase TruA [Candidatus Poribacteria bacterium]|nr:MAG: tRNA pseudouridine(38-40) synthase TruA [Candidatus Poribacteria bacterium]
MRNIKITIEYDGTNYHGWQIQPNAITIQAAIQDALTKITKTQTQIIGAGRTDAGVHAAGQVANFHTHSQMSSTAFQKALNATLPRDIVIIDVEEVPPDFHARFSAVSRTYRYTILNRTYPSALLRNNAYFFPEPIDVQGADTACRSLVGVRDFSSFQRSGSERINPTCEIYECRCLREEDLVYFEIEADAFLRGMVRAIVGTFLKLNDKEDGINQLHKILNAQDRSAAGASAPPHGLSLLRVKY